MRHAKIVSASVSIYFRPRRSTDRTQDSGSCNRCSIPLGSATTLILVYVYVILEHMQTIISPTIQLPLRALKRGVVLLDKEEYDELRKNSVPTYYLQGKAAEDLDKEIEEALLEDREGKTQEISSLSDLD